MKLRLASLCAGILIAALGLPSAPARADVTYHVAVDTFGLLNTPGNLDLQFNSAGTVGVDALGATANITNFLFSGTPGSLAGTATDTGDASGSLPGAVTLDNGGFFNDVYQGITYGGGFSFDATFSGPLLAGGAYPNGTTFALSLYDAANNPLLTTDASGAVLAIDLNPNGTTSVRSFADSNGTFHASATPLGPAAVPELGTFAGFGVLLALGGALVWRGTARGRPARSFAV